MVEEEPEDTLPVVGAAPGSGSSTRDPVVKHMVLARLFSSQVAPPRIGRFVILNPLGAGGMGHVYAAYDEQLDRKVAVKILKGAGDPESEARLLREAQALARVSHVNVVTVHEAGVFEGRVFLAMAFIRGDTLDRWLAARGDPPPWEPLVDAYVQAGRGLAAAHEAGLVHRDFKPQNVLVTTDGVVKVIDFGLARTVGGPPEGEAALPGSDASMLRQLITQQGALIGTPAYMALEQLRAGVSTERSDQFAFCVSMYESLHGRRPFVGATLAAYVEALVAGPPAAPPTRGRPAWLHAAIVRGLDPDPAARWPSMRALLEALERQGRPADGAEQRRQLRSLLASMTVVPLTFAGFTSFVEIAPGNVFRPVDLVNLWLALLAVTLVLLVIWRGAAFRPGTNRRITALLVTILGFTGLNRWFGWSVGAPVAQTLLHDLILFSAMFTAGALAIERWFAGAAVVTLAGAVGIVARVDLAPALFSTAAALMFPALLVGQLFARRWRRRAARGAAQ